MLPEAKDGISRVDLLRVLHYRFSHQTLTV